MGLPATSALLAFMIASLTTLLIPGPAVVYVVTRSVEYGRGGALWSVLGVETGAVVHALAAAGGVAAVLQTSPTALTVVRLLGVGYLLWLAIRQFGPSRQLIRSETCAAPRSRLSLYRDGLLVDLLNPKTALFFLAFVPQFIDPSRGSPALQSGLLGLFFVGLALICDGGYAMAASRLSVHWTSARFQLLIRRLTGTVYLALAAVAAFA
ncbi:LysE family translocator [Microlunatus soli]|nr:LysE family translocator [Microlunatus soli]